MEVASERRMEFGGGGDTDIGGRMEAGEDKSEREGIVEEIEVDPPIPSRKSEPLYKTHEKQFLAFFPEEVT